VAAFVAKSAAAQEAAALAELGAAPEAAERRHILPDRVQRWLKEGTRELPDAFVRVYCVLFGAILFVSQLPGPMAQWQNRLVQRLVQWEISSLQERSDAMNLPGAVFFCAPLWAMLRLLQILESMMTCMLMWHKNLRQDVLDALQKEL
jgi:hypothetical protein